MQYPDGLDDQVQQLAGFGIAVIDLITGEVSWSDEFYRLYGWEPGEVPPTLESLLSRVYAPDVARVRGSFTRERQRYGTLATEFRVVRPNGELRTMLSRARMINGDDGRPRWLVATETDITEHKETAARLVFADRMASVGSLAGGVAHEINNPLAFISAHLALIEERLGAGAPREVAMMLEETRYGVTRIRNIVRGLQAFSRTDDGQRAPLDLQRVLDLAVLMADNQIRHRAQLVRSSGELPAVVGNQATLGQVFLNLLVNAAEAIPEGQTAQHQVTIATRTDTAGWAIIEVRDTGRGIAREIQDRIFDPFFTTKPVGAGTGLGLSICHGIVRSLGGEIGFSSEPGKGSVFRVALPPAVAPVRAEPIAPPLLPIADAEPTTKVMILDDEVVFATALKRLLARDHAALVIVHDGREAIARVQAGERFDAIVCDLMMPLMSGMEVHAQLAALAPDLAARMVFLTGGAFSPWAKEFLARISNPWFDKPCDLDSLRAAILRVAKS